MSDEEIDFHIDTIERLSQANMLKEIAEVAKKLPKTKEVKERILKALEGGKIAPKKQIKNSVAKEMICIITRYLT